MHDLNPISRRLAILAAFAAIALLGGASRYPGLTAPTHAAKLDKLSAYLNAIHTLKSNFVQLGPEGDMVQGEFSLSRPGKLRFSYNPPSPVLIVATDGSIYVKISAQYGGPHILVGHAARHPAEQGCRSSSQHRRHRDRGTARRAGGACPRLNTTRSQSNITLIFSYPGIELRQWMVKTIKAGRPPWR